MDEIREYLPFLIPLVVLQLSMLGYSLYHIFTHTRYKSGSRTIWVVLCLVLSGFIGPILYFLLGREDS